MRYDPGLDLRDQGDFMGIQRKFMAYGLFCALVGAGFSGCDSSDSNPPGNPAAYDPSMTIGPNGNVDCSQQFVSDYDSLRSEVATAATAPTADSLATAQSDVNSFASEYHDVVCDAQKESDGSATTVTVNEIVSTWDNAITSALTLLQDESQDCSAQFISDYDQINTALATATTATALNAVQVQVTAFSMNYAGAVCTAANPSTGASVVVNESAQVSSWQATISADLLALPPVQAQPTTLVSQLYGNFTITVENPSQIELESSSDTGAITEVIDGGFVVAPPSSSSFGNPYCSLVLASGQTVVAGTVLSLAYISDTGGILTATSAAGTLTCTYPGDSPVTTPMFKLSDLNSIFGSLGYATGYVQQQ